MHRLRRLERAEGVAVGPLTEVLLGGVGGVGGGQGPRAAAESGRGDDEDSGYD